MDILDVTIIGPLFIDGNLNGEIYTEMLDRIIEPRIIHEVENRRDHYGNIAFDEHFLHSSLCTSIKRVVR